MSDVSTTSVPATARPAPRQKVPPFARYKGTSAWRKNPRRVRDYAMFRAAEALKQHAPATPSA